MEICNLAQCTGCGMCSNICPKNAISLKKGVNGFIYPGINDDECINCGLCVKKCPANSDKLMDSTMKKMYAAWNTEKLMRKKSTSGGISSLLEDEILKDGGAVIGVKWGENFCPEYSVAFNQEQAEAFRGSKYVQSNTGDIYLKVRALLDGGKKVLFTGTPCQIAALRSFLGREYEGLFTIDLVCHGVPSYDCVKRYLNEASNKYGSKVCNVRMRYKSPYWDYCSVRIDFENGKKYQKYTVDDPYFTLFNIGYTLRESCHNCKYTTVHREGDLTLADFWGYIPSGYKMRNYNKGISLVAVNSDKGNELFERIQKHLNFEVATKEAALKTNKSFYEPYVIADDKLADFWQNYNEGVSIEELCRKYVINPFKLPNLLFLRRLKNRYNWVIKRR